MIKAKQLHKVQRIYTSLANLWPGPSPNSSKTIKVTFLFFSFSPLATKFILNLKTHAGKKFAFTNLLIKNRTIFETQRQELRTNQ